jgi:hypothetical protein
MSRDFLLQVFFHESSSLKPPVNQKHHFNFFFIFLEIFASQGAPQVATGINDTGGKIFPLVPVPAVSTTPGGKK